MKKRARIYLAGPGVFEEDAIGHSEKLKALCDAQGLTGVFPLDAGLDLSGLTKANAAQAIYQANIELIEECDGLLADMRPFRGPGMDGGTAFEMGYARALGKPIAVYGAKENYLERCRHMPGGLRVLPAGEFDQDQLLVEDFDLPDNLMMSCSTAHIFKTPEEALGVLKRLCGSD